MKTRALFLSSPRGPRSAFQIAIFTFLAFLCLNFGSAETAFAQPDREVSVEVGRISSNRLRKQVYANSVRVEVSNPSVARAWLDTDSNRFRIEGLSEGTAKITFTGNYRQILVGSALEERGIGFRHVIDVRVLRRFVAADSRTVRLSVSSGRQKTFSIEYLLGPQFANRNEEGVRWRRVSLVDGENRVANGLYNNTQLKFRLIGVNRGRTTIVLQGERLNNRVWQKVVRRLEITVG